MGKYFVILAARFSTKVQQSISQSEEFIDQCYTTAILCEPVHGECSYLLVEMLSACYIGDGLYTGESEGASNDLQAFVFTPWQIGSIFGA